MQTTLTPTASGRMPYFAALDGVRAWCILLVMFDHLKSGSHTLAWLNGHLGVDLFFLISGFLITTLLRREHAFTGHVQLRAFYWRRIFRIVPVYVVVLLLYAVVLQAPSQATRWLQFKAALPYFLTFLNEFAHEPANGSVFLHTWSLGVEEKFYLIWPLLFFVIAHGPRTRVATLLLLFVAVSCAPLLGWSYLARAYFGLLMGSLLALSLAGRYAPRCFALLRRLPPLAALTLFLLGFAAEHVSKLLFPVFSLTSAIFIGSMLARPGWLARLHQSAPLTWIGRRSYAMYLLHVLCLNLLESRVRIDSGIKAALVLAAAFALTAAAAEILFRVVEQPARNFGRAWLTRQHEVSAAM